MRLTTNYGRWAIAAGVWPLQGLSPPRAYSRRGVVVAQETRAELAGSTYRHHGFHWRSTQCTQVRESVDIAMFTPGVHIGGSQAGQMSTFTIRGVTQNDFNDIVETPNAVYLDDGYLAIAPHKLCSV